MKKMILEEFIERAREVHGDKYDYSKVVYINSAIKVCIICPKHGEFWQQPREHLRKQGCPKCSKRGSNKNGSYTTEEFVRKAKEIHGDEYIYTRTIYKNSKTKVCIICPKHGEFWQAPDKHLSGQKCPVCQNKKRKSTEEFIEGSKEIHGDEYIYTKTVYKNNTTKVCIICPKHGEFWQTPKHHLKGCGCPVCKQSHLEEEIGLFFKDKNIAFVRQHKPTWLKPMSLDFYLPYYNVAIECQGEQHFNGWSGSKESLSVIEGRDNLKRKLCQENNVKLLYYSNLGIEYPYKVYEDKEELLKEITRKE